MARFIKPISIEGNVALIPLTKGYYARVDLCDAEKVANYNWRAMERNRNVYAVRQVYIDGKSQTISMHRLIIDAPNGMQVDHIDRVGINNVRSNLRLATASENQRNKGKYSNNKSGYKGVSFHNQSGKWQAQIRANGKINSLGLFLSPEQASLAYAEASRILHGEFWCVE